MSEALKPCPFCGGDADSEWYRDYRHFRSGEIGRSIAVYCTACHADMTICRADVPELSADDTMATLVEAWNRRTAPAEESSVDPTAPTVLDVAWTHINVLGAPDTACRTAEDLAYCRGIGDALAEIEKLGGQPS